MAYFWPSLVTGQQVGKGFEKFSDWMKYGNKKKLVRQKCNFFEEFDIAVQ